MQKTIAMLLVLLLCFTLVGCGQDKKADTAEESNPYEEIKKYTSDYWDAYNKEDTNIIMELLPEYVYEFNKERDVKDYYKGTLKMDEDMEDEFGSDIEISYTITDTDEYDEEDLEDFIDNMKKAVEAWEEREDKIAEFDPDTIEGVMDVEMDVTISGDKKKKELDHTLRLIKIDGNWYLYESRWTPQNYSYDY